jgi:hypothetical protein
VRSIYVMASVIAVLASPAFGEPGKVAAQHAPQAGPYDVYGGKKRHTDPDPNVLFEMNRQRNWRKGG